MNTHEIANTLEGSRVLRCVQVPGQYMRSRKALRRKSVSHEIDIKAHLVYNDSYLPQSCGAANMTFSLCEHDQAELQNGCILDT